MTRRLILLVTAVMALVALSGCSTVLGPSEGTLEGDMTETEFETFLDERDASIADLETHTMDMTTTMSVEGHGGLSMNVAGAVNTTAEEARVEYDMSDSPGRMPPGYSSEFTAYFDMNHMYMERSDGGWEKIPLEEVDEANMDEIWNLEDAGATEPHYHYGDVYVEEGEDVITVTTELTGHEMETALDESGEDVTGLRGIGGASFGEVTIVERFDADTYYPLSVEMDGSVSDGGETATFSVTTEYDEHNENVTYAIPEGVRENAEEGPSVMNPFA